MVRNGWRGSSLATITESIKYYPISFPFPEEKSCIWTVSQIHCSDFRCFWFDLSITFNRSLQRMNMDVDCCQSWRTALHLADARHSAYGYPDSQEIPCALICLGFIPSARRSGRYTGNIKRISHGNSWTPSSARPYKMLYRISSITHLTRKWDIEQSCLTLLETSKSRESWSWTSARSEVWR